ncbi:hypothetical protein FOA52_002761 [Chlamydomonas sp. UWO 241]|nr:hypothetical protein FOA52_002761 [Chlamydomonas sp. UWO 241]
MRGRCSQGARRSRGALLVTAAVGRRRALIRRRASQPARQRKRRKYQDLPSTLQGVHPGDAEFEGRLMTEIGSVNGPRQLVALVSQFGPDLSDRHLAAALSRLAGFVVRPAARTAAAGSVRRQRLAYGDGDSDSDGNGWGGASTSGRQAAGGVFSGDGDGGGGGDDDDIAALITGAARRCASVLLLRSGGGGTGGSAGGLEPMPAATALLSLGRLRVYNGALCEAVVALTFDRLGQLPPDGLAALIGGLADVGHAPSGEWLGRFCVESFARMARFNGPELASTTHALATLRHSASPQWLASAMRAYQGCIGTSATPPATARLLYALAMMKARPTFNWVAAVLADVLRSIDAFTGRELAALLWATVALGHPQDALFMEAWFVAAGRRMGSLGVTPTLLTLSALAATAQGQRPAPARFARLLLPHVQTLLPAMSAEQLSDALSALVAMRLRPSEQWMGAFEDELEARLPRLSDPARYGSLCWALGRLRYRPADACTRALVARGDALVPRARAHDAGLAVWGAAQAELGAPPGWGAALLAKVDARDGVASAGAGAGAGAKEAGAQQQA